MVRHGWQWFTKVCHGSSRGKLFRNHPGSTIKKSVENDFLQHKEAYKKPEKNLAQNFEDMNFKEHDPK